MIVYFSSKTENTHKLVQKLNLPNQRISKDLLARWPYLLIIPSYGDGIGKDSVPKPVIHFLNNSTNRELLKGVIGSGNRNFGELFGFAANIIADKCNVPLLHKFELDGTKNDITIIRNLYEQIR